MALKNVPGPYITVIPEALTSQSFMAFGIVSMKAAQAQMNPAHHAHAEHSSKSSSQFSNAKEERRQNVEEEEEEEGELKLTNLYPSAPSQTPAEPRISMVTVPITPKTTRIEALKRLRYTSLSIIPLGPSSIDSTLRYLIVVAPSIPSAAHGDHGPAPNTSAESSKGSKKRGQKRKGRYDVFSRARPSPFTNDRNPPALLSSSSSPSLPSAKGVVRSISSSVSTAIHGHSATDAGLPDLSRLRAFQIANNQCLNLSAGVWYSLYIIDTASNSHNGKESSAGFVVVRYRNGNDSEDTETYHIAKENKGYNPVAQVTLEDASSIGLRSKL